MRLLQSLPVRAGPRRDSVLQRCGGVSCPPGTCAHDDEKVSRTASEPGPSIAPAIVHEVIATSGAPIGPALRAGMERRLGHDFGSVRVHSGSRAGDSAAAVGSLAYTVGNHVVLGRTVDVDGEPGRRILAHELIHTLQQGGHAPTAGPLPVSQPSEPGEREAEHLADAVTSWPAWAGEASRTAGPGRIAPLVQRACGPVAIGAPAGCSTGTPEFLTGYPAYRFKPDCDEFAAGEDTRLVSDVTALSPTARFEVHAYTSTAGDPAFNQHLGCARALSAQALLTGAAPGGAGLAAGQITAVVNHGPTPGPVAARQSVVLAPPTPAARPAAIPAAGPGDFTIERVADATPSQLFFARNSSTLEGDAVIEIAALKAGPAASVTLNGFASADEPAALAQTRADVVKTKLETAPTNITVTAAVGNAAATATRLDFSGARSVEIVKAGATSSVADCTVTPPKQPCTIMDPATWTAFNDGLAVANDAMARATTAVAGAPAAADAAVIDQFFGNHGAATLATLRTNLTRLKTHVSALPASTSCGGQCDVGKCENENVIAYNHDVDLASTMTVCVPTFKGIPLNDRARNLIHESAHGTTPLGGGPTKGTRDVAYRHERMLFELSPADRLRNSDSYALFALFLREAQLTGPGAVPGGIDTPATDAMAGFTGAEPDALKLAVAKLEKRLTWAADKTGQLFGVAQNVRSGAAAWAGSWASPYMSEAASVFPLTSPPGVPVLSDITRLASIHERYQRMLTSVKHDLTLRPAPTGSAAWVGGVSLIAGDTVDIGPDFFRATPAHQIGLLFDQLAASTLDVEAAFIPAYRTLAEWIHAQNP